MRRRFSKVFIVLALCLSFFTAYHHVAHAQYGSGQIPGQPNQWNMGQNQSNPTWANSAPVVDYDSKDRASLDVAGKVMDWILQMWLKGITAALYVMGASFDFVTNFALQGVGRQEEGLQRTITVLWQFVRDISNIIIVFSLLYLAIRTIIEGEGFADKSKLVSILVAALLINFSLLFTQLAFNVSNYVARAIQSEIQVSSTSTAGTGSGGIADIGLSSNSLSGGIARLLGVPKGLNFISDSSLYRGGVQQTANLIDPTNYNDDYAQIQAQYLLMLTISVLGVGFILIAGAGILLYRYIVFIFLMILAPLGLVCFFIPYLKNIGDKWLSNLKSLTIIAPVYFLSFYICMQLLNGIIALGNEQTGSFHAFLVQMFTQTALIVGTLLGTVMFPIMAANAGSGALGKMGGWASGKIRALPKWTAQQTGRAAAGTSARTGRYLFGNQLSKTVGGRDKAAVEALQKRARDGSWVAKARLASAEGLKNKTYDLRNVNGIGKKFGIGDGIKNWDTAVEERKKKFEEKQKKEMSRYGYDQVTRENRDAVVQATARRDNANEDVKQKQQAYNQAMASGNVAAQAAAKNNLKLAQQELENFELQLGIEKNKGLEKQYNDMTRRLTTRVGRRMSPVQREALERMRKEMEKKFKEDGKAKKKK